MQQKHPDRLPDDQRHVLFMLSPMYQRVYLYVLDDEQREQVAVFERRGENPYQAIDNILFRDRKISDPAMRKKCRPSEKSRRKCQQTKYYISETNKKMHHDEEVTFESDDDYEIYNTEVYKPTKRVYAEKPEYRAERFEAKDSGECQGCESCKSKKYSTRRVKSEKPTKKGEKGPRVYHGTKKYEYKDIPSKRKPCSCKKL